MFCGKCGTQNPDNARFCRVCGASIGLAFEQPAAAPAQTEQSTKQKLPSLPKIGQNASTWFSQTASKVRTKSNSILSSKAVRQGVQCLPNLAISLICVIVALCAFFASMDGMVTNYASLHGYIPLFGSLVYFACLVLLAVPPIVCCCALIGGLKRADAKRALKRAFILSIVGTVLAALLFAAPYVAPTDLLARDALTVMTQTQAAYGVCAGIIAVLSLAGAVVARLISTRSQVAAHPEAAAPEPAAAPESLEQQP